MNLLHLLANDGFICVNKHIIKQLGLESAVLIGELVSIYTYNENKGNLEDEWFYATIERILENTGLSEYKQQQSISELCQLGILEQKLQGVPRKRYLKFNKQKLYTIIFDDGISQILPEQAPKNSGDGTPLPKIWETVPKNLGDSSQKFGEQAPKNLGDIYNNNYNIKDNTKDNTLAGVSISNKNTMEILEKNNQNRTKEPRVPTPPRGVTVPKISAESRIPKNTRSLIIEWARHPEAKKALEDYALFLLDTYNFKDCSIKEKISQICRMASNVPEGIEVICRYNIDKNYASPFKPSDYSKRLIQNTVVSSEFDGEFVTDADGNIVEV